MIKHMTHDASPPKTGKKIGLIAGSGQFPLIFAQKAKSGNFSVHAAAYVKEASPELEGLVDRIEWLHLGQLRRLIRFFKKNGVTEAVMMGAISKRKLFSDVKPDTKAISLIASCAVTHDDGVLRAFARALEKEGIKILPSTFLLPEILAPAGRWTKRKPSRSEKADIEVAWRLAKEIGRLDIGQCVVAEGGSVLAVEAIDGTDATIRRGGELGNGGAVVAKICKPNQDRRFDIPATGAGTIKTMHESGVRALAIEAGAAVVFDREEMLALADQWGISIVAR
ncbi:conserved hypothetical protein [Candidatus Desulfarcum epimagneticum]|uniref:DUF1009 domain-containing protein n=1 Tax=uncultured Desulfobacteraceae bacterium TaxID=218296 RepID=A0A484HHN3_9BACT|nr:conserved hypothetical protein [uncultured Desulfobacteraceae bacterium]